MQFPKNKLKAMLKAGQPAVGTFLNVPSPDIVEMIGYAGLDFVIIDLEHGRPDLETIENMVRAAEVSGLTSIIRIPSLDRGNFIHALDSGAMGVQVPMVDDVATARQVVQLAKYYPHGIRGLAGGRATRFGAIPLPQYVKEANEETMVIAQVETLEGGLNASGIASVPGVDLVFIGPTDLSQSMGMPGLPTDSVVLAKVDEIAAKVIAAGKPVGCLTGSIQVAAEQIKKGMQYLCIPAVPVYGHCKDFVEAVRKM
jgi:4-hydroxy-2-oxoheptanedioate aldolase